MSHIVQPPPKRAIVYPDSDGQPMADNTLQFRWIVTIEGGLEAQFRDDPNVFVAGDLLWYPVEGEPRICVAPDALVAFGRPKGYRGSYKQWEENNTPLHVVFEIMSPKNTVSEMIRKLHFYERYGVEEYYLYDPDRGHLSGWVREGAALREIADMNGWVSPRLGVRFELADGELLLYGRDGRPFATYLELAEQREQAQREKEQAQREKEEAQRRAEALAAQLRALGVEPQP
jgi:Uma2 family endonuclease